MTPTVLTGPAAGGKTPPRAADPLARWRDGVTIAPVSRVAGRHTMHAYYTASPERPGGGAALFYASTTREGYTGSLYLAARGGDAEDGSAAGQEIELVSGLTVEDAHRAACQQWVSGGRRVVYHDYRDGAWVVAALDVSPDGATHAERVLTGDRLVGWGQPEADLVPLYGTHWLPNTHRDLELLDVASGAVRTVLTAEAVRAAYPEAVADTFGDRPVSIFFPVLSPDLSRVFFKLATATGEDFRSPKASRRAMLICYDLAGGRFLFADERWAHPAWHPDSRTIVDVPHALIDSDTGSRRTLDGLPPLPGAHPSFSPDGTLCVSDVALDRMPGAGAAPGEWGIVVEDLAAQRSVLLHRFDESQGAASWRRCHPHPVFSPDGRRIYFSTGSSPWTQLQVAVAPD